MAGRNRDALLQFDHAFEIMGDDTQLGRQIIGFSTVIFARFYRAIVVMTLGQLPEAESAAETALRLARADTDPETLRWTLQTLALLSAYTGELGNGVAYGREGLEIAERLGSNFSRVTARINLAAAHNARQDHPEAPALVEGGLDITRESGIGRQYEAGLTRVLSEARLGLADSRGARAAAIEGSRSRPREAPNFRRLNADWRAARRCRIWSIRRPSSNAPSSLRVKTGAVLVPDALVALTDACGVNGDNVEHLRRLREAHRLFEQQGATGHARRIGADIADAPA